MSLTSFMIRRMFGRGDKKRDKGLTNPDDVKRYNDITYGPHGKWNKLDVYRPRDIKGFLPVLINVHGGGWVYGTKEVYQFYCMSLAQNGFAVVNFNFRLAPEHKYPAAFEDINKVITWVIDSFEAYGFDLNNVFLIGDSAGAHMAALYSCICTNPAYSKHYNFTVPNRFVPRGLALSCGLYNLSHSATSDKMTKGMLKDLLGKGKVEEKLDLINPLKHMTKDFPPALVMTSTGDFLKEQPVELLKKFDDLKVPYLYKIYGDQVNQPQHVFHCNMRSAIAKECNDQTCEYLKSLLQK